MLDNLSILVIATTREFLFHGHHYISDPKMLLFDLSAHRVLLHHDEVMKAELTLTGSEI